MTNTELKREHPKFSHPQSIVPGVSAGNILESHEPHGVPMKDMWSHQKDHMQLVSPLNRRKFEVLVVGTGLSAGSAAAALGELGYKVKVFTYHDSPRRAHSIAAQGGVNASRAKKVDNDSAYRHTKDTVKGGDYRCRESDCWRLANESVRVIDHMNAIGAPFAREYGGTLATRSFGGVQVSRTYYTRGQTPAIGLATAVVAALHGVLGVAVGGVIVHLLGTGGVDTTLCGDGVRTTRGVMEGEDLHLVAQLAQCGRGGTGGQAGTNHENLKLAAVQRGYQLHVVLLVGPHILHRHAVRLFRFEDLAGGDARNNGLWVREIWVLALEFSISHGFLTPLADQAQGNGQRHNDVADADNGRDDVRQDQEGLTPLRTGDTQVRGGKANAVGEVQEQEAHGDHVHDGDRPAAEGCNHVGLHRALCKVTWGDGLYAHGQVQQVEDDEQQQN